MYSFSSPFYGDGPGLQCLSLFTVPRFIVRPKTRWSFAPDRRFKLLNLNNSVRISCFRPLPQTPVIGSVIKSTYVYDDDFIIQTRARAVSLTTDRRRVYWNARFDPESTQLQAFWVPSFNTIFFNSTRRSRGNNRKSTAGLVRPKCFHWIKRAVGIYSVRTYTWTNNTSIPSTTIV